MVKRGLGRRWSQESEQLRRIERTCMRNLLYSTEERVYFKDMRSRFLLVSAGWIAAIAPDRTLEEIVGKTDFDFFSKEHADIAAVASQDLIIAGGQHEIDDLRREKSFQPTDTID